MSSKYNQIWRTLIEDNSSILSFDQKNIIKDNSKAIWRVALLAGEEGQKALHDFSLLLQVLSEKNRANLKSSLQQIEPFPITPTWLAQEAILIENFSLFEALIEQQKIPALLNNAPSDMIDNQVPNEDPTTLGQFILQKAKPTFLDNLIQHGYFDPTLCIDASISIADFAIQEYKSLTPLAWAVFYSNLENFDFLINQPVVQKDQLSLDQALLFLSFQKNNQHFFSNREEKPKLISLLLKLGANPNYEIPLQRFQRNKTEKIMITENWTAGYRWLFHFINRGCSTFGELKGLDKIVSPYLSQLQVERWTNLPPLFSHSALGVFSSLPQNPFYETILELALKSDTAFQQNTLYYLLWLSCSKNQGWPLLWGQKKGITLSATHLIQLVKKDILKNIETNSQYFNETALHRYCYKGWELQTLNSILPSSEHKLLKDFIQDFHRIASFKDKPSLAQKEALKLFLTLDYHPELHAPKIVKRL